LTVMMVVVVSLISLLVHIYSTAYMRGDRRYTWYFAALSLFTASMLTLVVAENLLQLLVGWELVGVCSFMLIGHWWEEPANARAAIKAFLTTPRRRHRADDRHRHLVSSPSGRSGSARRTSTPPAPTPTTTSSSRPRSA